MLQAIARLLSDHSPDVSVAACVKTLNYVSGVPVLLECLQRSLLILSGSFQGSLTPPAVRMLCSSVNDIMMILRDITFVDRRGSMTYLGHTSVISTILQFIPFPGGSQPPSVFL